MCRCTTETPASSSSDHAAPYLEFGIARENTAAPYRGWDAVGHNAKTLVKYEAYGLS